MWEFILSLLSLVDPTVTPKDYIGPVAAEAAYSAAMPTKQPVKPKVPTSECKTCNGTGRVRTGDDQGWTKCPDCEPDISLTPTSAAAPVISK